MTFRFKQDLCQYPYPLKWCANCRVYKMSHYHLYLLFQHLNKIPSVFIGLTVSSFSPGDSTILLDAIQSFSGHVMTEVYVLEKWILLDNDGTFVEDYDCMNPFISTMDDQGLFTYAKGKDIWDYGVREESDTHNLMINFSDNIGCFEDKFNSVIYEWSS